MTANHPTHAGKFYLTKPVFFIGFMGAGKTSISQQIAVTCGVASIDADEYLEFREDRIVADIFAEDGEEAFRDIETDVLRDLVKRSPRLIGCGGGVVTKRPVNAQIMKEAGYVVFKNLETARKTIVEREPQYEAAADVSVDTEGRTIRDVADEVVELLLDAGVLVKRD